MRDKILVPIDAKVLFQMYEYATYAKHHFGTEIAGWGHYLEKRGIYKLAPLTKQAVSGAEVDNFPNEILNNTEYDISDMLVQWHSHVDMGVTPSGVDISNINDTLKIMPVLISIIVNCRNQYSARLDVGNIPSMFKLPSRLTLDVELVPYYKNSSVSKEVKNKCYRPTIMAEEGIAVYHPSFEENDFHYHWNHEYQSYGRWQLVNGTYEFIKYKKNDNAYGQLEFDFPLIEYNSILAQMNLISENNSEFEYISTHDRDTLQHIKTGLSISVNDMGAIYGQKLGGKELINEFLNDCKKFKG